MLSWWSAHSPNTKPTKIGMMMNWTRDTSHDQKLFGAPNLANMIIQTNIDAKKQYCWHGSGKCSTLRRVRCKWDRRTHAARQNSFRSGLLRSGAGGPDLGSAGNRHVWAQKASGKRTFPKKHDVYYMYIYFKGTLCIAHLSEWACEGWTVDVPWHN